MTPNNKIKPARALLLAAALLLWFFPKLLVVPLVFLLAVGALSTLMYAVKQYLSLHRRKPPQ